MSHPCKVLASLAVVPLGQSVLDGLARKARTLLTELQKHGGRAASTRDNSKSASASTSPSKGVHVVVEGAGSEDSRRNSGPRPARTRRRSGGEGPLVGTAGTGVSVVALPPGLIAEDMCRPLTAPCTSQTE